MVGMLAPAGINDDDVRHARRALADHQVRPATGGPARCDRCGGYYPCVASRIAATVLAASLPPPAGRS